MQKSIHISCASEARKFSRISIRSPISCHNLRRLLKYLQELPRIRSPGDAMSLARRSSMQPSKGSAQRTQQNRTNAQNSTGPRTEEGKQRSSQNAIKHGLTGQAVLLLSEDAAAYESHLQKYLHDYQPKGIQEEDLVRSIAAVAWRLNRLLGIESKVLSQDTSTADDVYQQTRALSNLSLYEHRLARQAERSRERTEGTPIGPPPPRVQPDRRRRAPLRNAPRTRTSLQPRRRWLRFFYR